MKRVFSLALAALLLAGCTVAPSGSSTSSSTVTTETSTAQEVESTSPTLAPAQPLEPLRIGDERQYYMTDMLSGGLIRC
ncbi:MAG: lipoprotein [Gemmiger sp.]|uniref:lipoprotein n=2 Tax=Subdoligranulum variabile TaxID=214851 RepID=UPI0026F1BB9E|nr:lipoprotein [Subdoligranulum variabile]